MKSDRDACDGENPEVRAMVGTLFDVGRGRYPEGTVNEIFADRFKGERTMAPPQALVLEDVIY